MASRGVLSQSLLALLLLLAPAWPGAHAHESRPAYLQITETAPSQFSLLWRTPMRGDIPLAVILKLPEGVRDTRPPLVQTLSDSRLERRWIDAGAKGLSGNRIGFPGLELTITEAIVEVETLDGHRWMGIARPSQPWVELAADRRSLQVAVEFTRQGIDHIFAGVDHLLFVFGLLLLVPGPWMLVKTVTAFTVAHSLTLAVATFGYVRPPVPLVEAAIAMSILFLGVEIVRARRGETSFTIERPWLVAFAFGLLHGFGFATVLSDAGLPERGIPLALLSFNIGVELGQLAFVAVVLVTARALVRLGGHWPPWMQLVPAYLVGTLGAFWTIQRLAAF
ncbi:HupE/UreJ family protein [Stappia sp. F7233]|uniref:HupE/UreJ family protein n=2 Tax=Stappia albiluteola TaxID=2758565 RepID=A0A839ACZ9_9HYPH|nr:HupE/UreJ family protein [Stappia albiluteola]